MIGPGGSPDGLPDARAQPPAPGSRRAGPCVDEGPDLGPVNRRQGSAAGSCHVRPLRRGDPTPRRPAWTFVHADPWTDDEPGCRPPSVSAEPFDEPPCAINDVP